LGNTSSLVVIAVNLPDETRQLLLTFDGLSVISLSPFRYPGDVPCLVALCQEHAATILLAEESLLLNAGPTLFSKLLPRVKILAYGGAAVSTAADLLHLGCSGSINTAVSPADFQRAFHAVASGELWFPRRVLSTAVRTLLSTVNQKRLTQREREVLRLIVQGFNNREIADSLFITRETVRWHVRSIYSKIGTNDRKRILSFAAAEDLAS
jgi:DNA-binding NarL/FixJ family response regulator